MLGVGYRVSNHVLKENLEDSSGLVVDQSADSLDSSTSSQASNSWLGDPLYVLANNSSVSFLGAHLA